MSTSSKRQAGVGLVTAIFLLVVLAGLAVAMVAVYTAQQSSSNLDLQGARAYQAARAGLEWGLFQELRNKSCTGASQFALPAGTSLSGFTVVVRCTRRGVTNGVMQVAISAMSCSSADASGGCTVSNNPEWVSRTVESQLTEPVPTP